MFLPPSTRWPQKWALSKWPGGCVLEAGHRRATRVRGKGSPGPAHWWDGDSEAELKAPVPVHDRVPWEGPGAVRQRPMQFDWGGGEESVPAWASCSHRRGLPLARQSLPDVPFCKLSLTLQGDDQRSPQVNLCVGQGIHLLRGDTAICLPRKLRFLHVCFLNSFTPVCAHNRLRVLECAI